MVAVECMAQVHLVLPFPPSLPFLSFLLQGSAAAVVVVAWMQVHPWIRPYQGTVVDDAAVLVRTAAAVESLLVPPSAARAGYGEAGAGPWQRVAYHMYHQLGPLQHLGEHPGVHQGEPRYYYCKAYQVPVACKAVAAGQEVR